MDVITLRVPSSDGIHTLAGKLYMPDNPVGCFQVVHGMTEHIGRYESFMRAMADAGYICFGYDNLGHGNTARHERELGYIAHRDGWRYLVRDVGIFHSEVEKRFGAFPYVLLGHSMGSFIVRCAVTEGLRPDRLIIMGTGGPNPASGLGLALLRSAALLKGERYVSEGLEGLIFGAYNRRFADENDRYAWLTTERGVRDVYRADPFCTFHFTVSALHDLVKLNDIANSRAWFDGVDKTLPMLLVSGKDDPVGSEGKGVTAVFDRLQKAGADVRMRLYDGRHEILNDACREQVVRDILSFCKGDLS
ncbi:MAG: alpha/beta fold hydrolase [Clostridia bacterium]|nr:alpha/beta fold hydrolase [Clostridia bacterium]